MSIDLDRHDRNGSGSAPGSFFGGHHNHGQHGGREKFGIAEIVNGLERELSAEHCTQGGPGFDRQEPIRGKQPQHSSWRQDSSHRPSEGVVQIDSARQSKLRGQHASSVRAKNLGSHIGWIGDHRVEADRRACPENSPRTAKFSADGRSLQKIAFHKCELFDGQGAQNGVRGVDGRAIGLIADQGKPIA